MTHHKNKNEDKATRINGYEIKLRFYYVGKTLFAECKISRDDREFHLCEAGLYLDRGITRSIIRWAADNGYYATGARMGQ